MTRNILGGLWLLPFLFAVVGCGAHRMSPVEPQAVAGIKPQVEDQDAGLVGVRTAFDPKAYTVLVIEPFRVAEKGVEGADDARLAKDMVVYLQAQLVRRFQTTGLFARVVDGSVASPASSGERRLRLQGELTEVTEGNRALRCMVGFGAGAAKAQIETRFTDAETRQIELVTADRRAAAFGIFGGDGRQFVTESMDQMADGLVKLVGRLAAGARPGK